MGQANEIRFIKDNVEEGKKDQPHRKTLRVHGQIAPNKCSPCWEHMDCPSQGLFATNRGTLFLMAHMDPYGGPSFRTF
jgi:hypothetical protein